MRSKRRARSLVEARTERQPLVERYQTPLPVLSAFTALTAFPGEDYYARRAGDRARNHQIENSQALTANSAMPALLHIDASPRGERSVSRQLTRDFALAWKQAHPGGKIIYRDLGHHPVPLVTETFIAAVYTPSHARSPELSAAVATADQLISELETATEYVFGVPMYNFSVPAGFKAYIDQIIIPGRTYMIDESGCKKALLHGKKATVITSSGWVYRNGSPLASSDHLEPWIRTIFGLIGVTDIDFVVADGLAEIERGKREREQYLRPIREEVQRKHRSRLAIPH